MVKPAIFARVLFATASLLCCGSSAQAGLIPWLYDSMFGPAYYPPAFSGYGISAGYAPYTAGYAPYYGGSYAQTSYYGPGFDCGCNPCGCQPCGGCSPCGAGGCASGNCTLNSAPAGAPTPIAEPRDNSGRTTPGGYDTPTRRPATGAGGGNTGTRTAPDTFNNSDPSNFETPETPGRGTNARPRTTEPLGGDPTDPGTNTPERFRPRTTPPPDNFNPRTTPGTDPGTGRTDPFDANRIDLEANKPILGVPEESAIPAAKPAAGGNVVDPAAEEAPADAAAALEGKTTHRPVVLKQRLVLRSRLSTPNIARVPVRPTPEWSAAPGNARIARQ